MKNLAKPLRLAHNCLTSPENWTFFRIFDYKDINKYSSVDTTFFNYTCIRTKNISNGIVGVELKQNILNGPPLSL
jgi:hypothetical protein